MDFPETLIRLIEFPTKETINIVTKKMICPINKSLASAISPLFFQAIKANPMLKEIYLPIDENIEHFFKGKMIDRELFFMMSVLLNNKELIKKWNKENEINIGNVIDHLKIFIKYKREIEDMEEEINFIGENFEKLENDLEIEQIPSEYLSEIFKKAKGITSEEKIKRTIIKRMKEEKNEYIRKKLIESIELEGLNDEDIQELFYNIRYEDLSEKLFLFIYHEKLNVLIKERFDEMRRKAEEMEKALLKDFKNEYQITFGDSDQNESLLHYIAKKNYKEIGATLVAKGADINAKDIIFQIMIILFLIKII